MKQNITVAEWLGVDNTLGQDIWEKKYRLNGETFDQWLDRVSGYNPELRDVIAEKKFLFAGRILSNRGDDTRGVTYSNCYVMTPPEDNIESIFHTAGKLARTFSYGGGCGIDISRLAPKGAKVNNSAKETSGAVSFMELYSMVTGLIGQNGRRGALMLSMDINHPDIEDFIDIKKDLDKVTKANISIKITDDFMNAVVNDTDYELCFKREDTGEDIIKTVRAKELFRSICESNWDYAEPGMLFWDTIKEWNMLSNNKEFEFAGVNPCAEEPLPAGGSCLLGSINLSEFVNKHGVIDEVELRRVVRVAVIALNEVLDEGLMKHPLEEQRISVDTWRQIGLGIFGLADMFIKMGVVYGSGESIDISNRIGYVISDEAIMTSAQLASLSKPYSGYNGKAHETSFIKNNTSKKTVEYVKQYGLRNSQILSIAPTGSISTMLGVSGGIEPIYDTHYNRKTESLHGEDKTYTVYTPIVKKFMDNNNITDVDKLPEQFITAKEIKPINRIIIQSIWQEKIDASISSTLNLPYEATIEDVMEIYETAWAKGLKGITIYRDKCKRSGILTSIEEPKKEEPVMTNPYASKTKPTYMIIDEFDFSDPVKLDSIKPMTRDQLGDVLQGNTYVKHTACGKMYITINRTHDNKLVEVFIDPGKSGGCSANAEALGRYASACMRSGMSIEALIDVTKGVKCSACTKVRALEAKKIDGNSCSDILARTIEQEYNMYGNKNNIVNPYSGVTNIQVNSAPIEPTIKKVDIISERYKDMLEIKEKTDWWVEQVNSKFIIDEHFGIPTMVAKCPECGSEIINSGGCNLCLNCGHSKCQ